MVTSLLGCQNWVTKRSPEGKGRQEDGQLGSGEVNGRLPTPVTDAGSLSEKIKTVEGDSDDDGGTGGGSSGL